MATNLETVNFYVGPQSTPQDIKDMRRSTFEYQRMYGMPVIHKHRWNLRDMKKGLAKRCPYHYDDTYEQDRARCPYCFGTGFLGGYADGQIVWVTFSDATEDRIRVGAGGILMFEREPQLTAPWIPDIGTGDLIITAEFLDDSFTVDENDLLDRFTLKEVKPITIRGYQRKVQTVEFKVQQNSQIERVPDGDILYDVPLIFDYGNLPEPQPEPVDPVPVQTFTVRSLKVVGMNPLTNYAEVMRSLATNAIGTVRSTTVGLAIHGDEVNGDVDFVWPSED
jgi:hypothetical protein